MAADFWTSLMLGPVRSATTFSLIGIVPAFCCARAVKDPIKNTEAIESLTHIHIPDLQRADANRTRQERRTALVFTFGRHTPRTCAFQFSRGTRPSSLPPVSIHSSSSALFLIFVEPLSPRNPSAGLPRNV